MVNERQKYFYTSAVSPLKTCYSWLGWCPNMVILQGQLTKLYSCHASW